MRQLSCQVMVTMISSSGIGFTKRRSYRTRSDPSRPRTEKTSWCNAPVSQWRLSAIMPGDARPRPDKELLIFCDESVSKGEFFSNFYGGVVVGSIELPEDHQELEELEPRSVSVPRSSGRKYPPRGSSRIRAPETILRTVVQDRLKIRIMFTQNAHEAVGLTQTIARTRISSSTTSSLSTRSTFSTHLTIRECDGCGCTSTSFLTLGRRLAQFREYILALHPESSETASFHACARDPQIT